MKMRFYLFFLFFIFHYTLSAIELTPYYQYQDQNIEFLQNLKTDKSFSVKDLLYWDTVIQELAPTKSFDECDRLRVKTYLYESQRDFAALALKYKGSFAGSIDLLSSRILSLFCVDYSNPADTRIYDPFTIALTSIVLVKACERLIAENCSIRAVTLQEGELFWKGKQPYFGEKVASFKPWHLDSAAQFRIPPLPLGDADFWKKQIDQVHAQMEKVGPNEKEKIFYWAHMREPGSGDWLAISIDYALAQQVPMEKFILFRADFASTLLDAFIAAFDSKYAFQVRRPTSIDPSIITVIAVPNHPSYPSAHSTVSGAAVEVLNFYFPENKSRWEELLEEAGISRIQAGIHYPIDHEEGKRLGKKVGDQVLRTINSVD